MFYIQGLKAIRNTKHLKYYRASDKKDPTDSESSVEELPVTKRRRVSIRRERSYRFRFNPPTPAWQKATCERFGLTYVK